MPFVPAAASLYRAPSTKFISSARALRVSGPSMCRSNREASPTTIRLFDSAAISLRSSNGMKGPDPGR
jgi:hypothetical protein